MKLSGKESIIKKYISYLKNAAVVRVVHCKGHEKTLINVFSKIV